jgi:hypothetical protein
MPVFIASLPIEGRKALPVVIGFPRWAFGGIEG